MIGTEEFMFPALYIGRKMEKEGAEVRCHSTTRSPIAVSLEKEYPLHSRYELKSLYDPDSIYQRFLTLLYFRGICDNQYLVIFSYIVNKRSPVRKI